MFYIKAYILPGTDVRVFIRECCQESRRLNIGFRADFNGVNILIDPFSNPNAIYARWKEGHWDAIKETS